MRYAVVAAMLLVPGMVEAQATPAACPASPGAVDHAAHHAPDSTFAKVQARGRVAMGVDQYTSTHCFDALPTGGRIELQRNADDAEGVATIRAHLQQIVQEFRRGEFSTPFFVHAQEVPGTKVMAERRAHITYTYRPLPRGGEILLETKDPAALQAIHEFMVFQRGDHRSGGH